LKGGRKEGSGFVVCCGGGSEYLVILRSSTVFITFRHMALFGGLSSTAFRTMIEFGTPFSAQLMKYHLVSLERGLVSLRLPLQLSHVGDSSVPAVHGGVISALVDHCSGFAAWSVLPSAKGRVTTSDLHVSYLLPAKPADGDLIASAKILHEGSKIIKVDVEVRSEKKMDRLLAAGRVSFFRKEFKSSLPDGRERTEEEERERMEKYLEAISAKTRDQHETRGR
jgi:uncharacterized protein (TIGR00369 family)